MESQFIQSGFLDCAIFSERTATFAIGYVTILRNTQGHTGILLRLKTDAIAKQVLIFNN